MGKDDETGIAQPFRNDPLSNAQRLPPVVVLDLSCRLYLYFIQRLSYAARQPFAASFLNDLLAAAFKILFLVVTLSGFACPS
jgi:hypothetical protein